VNIDVVLCVPSCEGPVRKAFDVTGVTPAVAVTGRLNEVTALEPTDGFAGAVINAAAFPFTEAMNLCRQLRSRSRGVGPIILLLDHYQLDELTFREDLFDDFVVGPFDVSELATRLRHRLRRAGNESVAPRVEHGGLSMNLETYQASIAGRVMDLTYMEYELDVYKRQLERRAECHVGALDRNRRDLDIEARRELFRVRDGVPR